MEQFNTVFQHWPQYRVIYCPQCRFCPVPAQIQAHLDTHHSQISPKTRRKITEAARSIPKDQVAYQPQDVIYPRADRPPIAGLAIYHDAYQCTGETAERQPCGKIRRRMKMIQAHCREAHGWQNVQKRGGNSHHKQHQTPEPNVERWGELSAIFRIWCMATIFRGPVTSGWVECRDGG